MAVWHRRADSGQEGFSLLEVTVALAIVAAVAAAALRIQHQSFRSYERAERLTEAILLAEEQLTRASLGTATAGEGTSRPEGGMELRWQVRFDPGPAQGVRAVRVRIFPKKGDDPILETMTYVPSPTAP